MGFGMSAVAALSFNRLDIEVRRRDGRAEAVTIASGRFGIGGAVFRGKAAAEAAGLARAVFALCPAAQSAAAAAAFAAASGAPAPGGEEISRALAAERVGENLRSCVLGWPSEPGEGPDSSSLQVLREALNALRALSRADEVGSGVATVRAAATSLGLAERRGVAPTEGWFGRLHAQIAADSAFAPQPAPLPRVGPRQDAAIFAALARGAPVGGGMLESAPAPISLATRLIARLDAIAEAIDALDGKSQAPIVEFHRHGPGAGGAAVESPRGRLYHWMCLDPRGRIADYRILAPTDWSFMPDGPFARALTGAYIGAGAEAERRVGWLAASFDPCVAFQVRVREVEDA